MLGYFFVRVEDEGERVFIDDMPVQDIHFVVHHGIDCLIEDFHRQEVSGCVDHQASIVQERLILDTQGKVSDGALFVLMSGAANGLHESLETSNKSHVGY